MTWDPGKREESEILAYHTFGVLGGDSLVRERHEDGKSIFLGALTRFRQE